MKRLVFIFVLLLVASGFALPSVNATSVPQELPNTPYVLQKDRVTLYHTGTEETITLNKEIWIHDIRGFNTFISTDKKYLVVAGGCFDCSSYQYVIDLADGNVSSKATPIGYKLAGANVESDRLLWTEGGKAVMTSVNGDVVWERDLGTNLISLSTDGQTVFAATTYLEKVEHLSALTGETLLARTFDKQANPIEKQVVFPDAIVYTAGTYNTAHYIYNAKTGKVSLTPPNDYRVKYAVWDNTVHWYSRGTYLVHDLKTDETKAFPIAVSPRLVEDVMIFSDGMRLPLAEYKKLPTEVELFVDKSMNQDGDPSLYKNQVYPVSLKVNSIDGMTRNVSVEQLRPSQSGQTIASPIQSDKVTLIPYDATYLGKNLKGTLNIVEKVQVSLYQYGVNGEVVGESSPNATITIEVATNQGTLTYTGKADKGGRFYIPTARLEVGAKLNVTSSTLSAYAYKQAFTVQAGIPVDQNLALISDSVETGVTFKTVPNGKISLYVKERYHDYYDVIQADGNGIARFTDTVDSLRKGVQIFYQPFGGFKATEKNFVVFDKTEPVFSLQNIPQGGDTSLTISSTMNNVVYTYYVNDNLVGTGKTITLSAPLANNDLIRVVAKNGDRTKTLEHRVIATGPTILQVTDVAMTATHTVVSVRRDTLAKLEFFINGKLTTATPVTSTRFTIPAKPGDVVLVRLTRGGQKLDTRLALPQVTFSNIRLHDEQTKWVGMVLPNSNAVLMNGSKQIASGKSSSTGRVVMSLAPQSLGSKVTLISTRGVYRFVQTVSVKAGLTPKISAAAPLNTSRSLTVNSNVDYGTITIHRGTTLVATKAVTSMSTPVAIPAQKSGTKLTVKLTTPKGRVHTVYVTVR